MQYVSPAVPPESDPGDMIGDRCVRHLYQRFLDLLLGIHEDVTIRTTRVEVRVSFGDALLCRVVPYRELFHVQLGEKNAWEIRVRDEAGCLETLDRVLTRFLAQYASGKTDGSRVG